MSESLLLHPPKPSTPPNPKQLFGDKKPPLDEFPLSAMILASLAGLDGDGKYGFRNWRDLPIEARTYIKGALRHIRLWEEGEENARDGVHNLGHAIMGLAILIDAQVHGSLVDNRNKSQAVCDLLHTAEADVEKLHDMKRERDAKKLAAELATARPEPSEKPLPNLGEVLRASERPPIPTHAYWSEGNFYHRNTGRGLGQDFMNAWFPRHKEFPREPWGATIYPRDAIDAG